MAKTLALELVLRPGGAAARAGADLPPRVAVRRPRGARRAGRRPVRGLGRRRAGARRARRGRACARSSTSAATAARCSSTAKAPGSRCSARTTRGRTGSTARSAPRRARTASRTSSRRACPLVPLRLETWGPFLFVNPDDDAPPLADTLGPVHRARPGRRPRLPRARRLRARRRTGRSPARTTSSATTARSRTRASAPPTTSTPTSTGSSRSGSTSCPSSRTSRARGRGAVPLRLAEPEDQRLRGHAEPLDRAAAARGPGALDRLPRLLLRAGRRPRVGRGAARIRPPGGRRGPCSRRARPERRALGDRRGGTAPGRERAARRPLPGARDSRSRVSADRALSIRRKDISSRR